MNRLPMDPDRWQRVCDLFEDAIELRGQARTDFIALHCKDDPVVHEALEAMLAGDARTALLDAALVDLVDTTALTPADAPDCSGERLGHFVLGNALGRGGMGVVYAAHREDDFRQQVAIKRLHQRWEGSLQAERFVQERQILAALSHPNIARLLDGGIDAHGQPWFAMERIEGAPITAWADDQHLSLSARIDLFRQVCRAVQHAHERFVVHRDLKPDNILVDGSGNAKVLDFGVAKLVDPLAENTTRTGMAVGFTPEYAAPEQISSGNITAATDVYSLGLILYQLLTGRLPYDLDAHDLPARMHAISQGTPMRLEQALISGDSEQVLQRLRWRNTDLGSYRRFVRGDLTRILQTALAKEPERRYATAQAMDDDLQRLLRGRPVSVSGDTFTYRARKFVSRNRWGVAMASLAVLALIGGSLGILLQSSRVQAEAARATREAEQQQAVTDFMLQVFSSASVNTGGDPDISLADAMKLAVDTALETHENNPQVTLGVLAAAATGYDELAQREQAVALIRQGLDIQQRHAPHALAERGRLLTLLSQLDIEAPLEQVLARAEEGLQAQYAAGSPPRTVIDAMTMVFNAHRYSGNLQQALEINDEILGLIRQHGLEGQPILMSTLSNRAMLLPLLDRHDEAGDLHRQALELTLARYPADGLRVARQRMFYGMALVQASQFDDALAQLTPALEVMRQKWPDNHVMTQMAVHWMGGALAGLGRYEEALPLHREAWRQTLADPGSVPARVQSTGSRLVRALGETGHCDEARTLVAEDPQQRSDWLSQTPCTADTL